MTILSNENWNEWKIDLMINRVHGNLVKCQFGEMEIRVNVNFGSMKICLNANLWLNSTLVNFVTPVNCENCSKCRNSGSWLNDNLVKCLLYIGELAKYH